MWAQSVHRQLLDAVSVTVTDSGTRADTEARRSQGAAEGVRVLGPLDMLEEGRK